MGSRWQVFGAARLTGATESYRKQKEAMVERNLTQVQADDKLGNANQDFMTKMLAPGAA
jgi:hypothetical protein